MSENKISIIDILIENKNEKTILSLSGNLDYTTKLYDLLLDFDSINNSVRYGKTGIIKFEKGENLTLQTEQINIEELQKHIRTYLFYGNHQNKISFATIWIESESNLKIKMGNSMTKEDYEKVDKIIESMIDNNSKKKKLQTKNYKYEGAIVIDTGVYNVNHPYLLLDNKK